MKKRGIIYLLVIALSFTNTFFISFIARAANTDIVVNEIAAFEKTGCEWLEIYNKGSEAVSMEGWKFWEGGGNHGLTVSSSSLQTDWTIGPGEYAIIAQDDTKLFSAECGYTPPAGTVFDSAWGTLNESGEEIGLKDTDGNFIEQFTYVVATDHSLERKEFSVNDYTSSNWVEHSITHTFGSVNSGEDVVVSPPPPNPPPTPTAAIIVINEFLSDPASGESEWIELYNPGSEPVDLAGWTLTDGVGTIASPTGTIATASFFVVILSSSRLNNDGDLIRLLRPDATVADIVAYGAWDDGNIADNAPKPARGNSTARLGGDFFETTTPTRGSANQITAPVVPPSPSPTPAPPPAPRNSSGGDNYGGPYLPGDIVINELAADPVDDEEEFVELYNRTGQTIDVRGWWIEDGSEAKTLLEGTIQSKGFLVVERPKGSLNNSGDRVVLIEPRGQEIDEVVYGSWQGGQSHNNASTPPEGTSLARIKDGEDTSISKNDFAVTSAITRGASNRITAPAVGSSNARATSGPILLTELFPNPEGTDEDKEFIELKNNSSSTVDLSGWQIVTPLKEFTIATSTITAGGFLVLPRSVTHLVLHNSGKEIVELKNADGSVMDKIEYSGTVKESFSFARRGVTKQWAWTTKPTPGVENIITGVNAAPAIAVDVEREVGVDETILFDASDTIDPDDDPIIIRWDFGDGFFATGTSVAHAFKKAGTYRVTIGAIDSFDHIASQKISMVVKSRQAFAGGTPDDTDREHLSKLIISEILPNPADSEENEFVEIYNPTDEPIDLYGVALDDEEGGSKPYNLPDDAIVAPRSYLVFSRIETKLALNNDRDTVRLLLPGGVAVVSATYDKAPAGASSIPGTNGTRVWTMTVTKGKANVVRQVAAARTTTTATKTGSSAGRVREEGIVSVLPGILGTQYFYISFPETDNGGVQIYMYSKQFPKLEVGDLVSVTGEVSSVRGERRIKTKSAADITILRHAEELPIIESSLDEIMEEWRGGLVRVSGEVTARYASYLYLDDGTEEIKVAFKAGVADVTDNFHEGDMLEVTGILNKSSDVWQILPRSASDLVKKESNTNSTTTIAENKNNSATATSDTAERYLTATAGGLTSILIGLVARARGAMATQALKRIGTVVVAFIRRKRGL